MTLRDLASWDMGTAIVQREWKRIDVFLRDELHQLSVLIENKIDTGEHGDQLSRYYESVQREFPNDRILALYLTKEGDEPSDERYLPVAYGQVCEAMEELAERHVSTLGQDVHMLMTHYAQMLRRHIMSDTEIARLCGLIYQKHRMALDLIYEHRPSHQSAIMHLLETLIDRTTGLHRGGTQKNRYVGFGPPEFDSLPGSPIYFVFDNASDSVVLRMQIKVDDGNRGLCRQIFELAAANQPPFNLGSRAMRKVYSNLFSRVFLSERDYMQIDSEEREDKIRRCWDHFLQHDLPPIREILAADGWLSGKVSRDESHV